jgi:hypothetical protein
MHLQLAGSDQWRLDIHPMAVLCLMHPPSGPRRIGELSKTHATGCGLLKGEPDPELRPDDQYPDWLWALAEPPPTSKELEAKYQAGEGLSVSQVRGPRLQQELPPQAVVTMQECNATLIALPTHVGDPTHVARIQCLMPDRS